MKTIKIAVVLIILAAALLVGYAWTGWYNVAVGTGHTPPVGWYLETLRERSIHHRSADLAVPGNLSSPARIRAGAGHYQEMCQGCHGHPGREPAAVFDPRPPALYREAEEPAEIFWVVKHGIKMTAMPSHLRHTDDELWDIVSFVRQLPDLDQASYEELIAEATHDHGDEPPEAGDEDTAAGANGEQAAPESGGEVEDGSEAGGEDEHGAGDEGPASAA